MANSLNNIHAQQKTVFFPIQGLDKNRKILFTIFQNRLHPKSINPYSIFWYNIKFLSFTFNITELAFHCFLKLIRKFMKMINFEWYIMIIDYRKAS